MDLFNIRQLHMFVYVSICTLGMLEDVGFLYVFWVSCKIWGQRILQTAEAVLPYHKYLVNFSFFHGQVLIPSSHSVLFSSVFHKTPWNFCFGINSSSTNRKQEELCIKNKIPKL